MEYNRHEDTRQSNGLSAFGDEEYEEYIKEYIEEEDGEYEEYIEKYNDGHRERIRERREEIHRHQQNVVDKIALASAAGISNADGVCCRWMLEASAGLYEPEEEPEEKPCFK